MNIIDHIRFQIQYPDLKKINIDTNILEKLMSNKHFKESYRKEIKPFINYLYNFSYKAYDKNKLVDKKMDIETISNHVSTILKTYNEKSTINYISNVKKYRLERVKKNIQVINDKNFEALYNKIGRYIFDDNIAGIIENGHSERVLYLIEKKPKIDLLTLNPKLLSDNIWELVTSDYQIGDTTLLDFICNKTANTNMLIEIINQGLLEGLKYTYENIPESHGFINNITVHNPPSFEQFNMNFINNIGNDVLSKLYYRHCFSDKNAFSNIFKICHCGNYELIQDIVNYDTYNFSFENIPDDEIKKDLLNTNIGYYNKNEILLNKYFGIERKDNYYIKLFLSSINKVQLSDEFKEKYQTIIDMLNHIYKASDEEILTISKKMSKNKKEDYKKLIYECEEDGNELIKNEFSIGLKKKYTEMLSTLTNRPLLTNSGKTIDTYELTGEPFTMLVHSISDNIMSENNNYVERIISKPENWNNIKGGNNYLSTSLISDKYMVTYGIPNKESTIMFGFYNIPSKSIKYTSVQDAGTNRKADKDISFNMRDSFFVANINSVVTIDELMDKTIEKNLRISSGRMWNEVIINRKNEETGEKLQPDYIVCMDTISENSKKMAEYFNIPIYLIKCEKYKELPYIPATEVVNQERESNFSNTGKHR